MRIAWLALVLLAIAPLSVAHAPVLTPGETEVVRVEDPTKSWAFYDELAAGGAREYRFPAEAGDRLYVMLLRPAGSDTLVRAYLVGPGLPPGDAPEAVGDIAGGEGVAEVPAIKPPRTSLEPFTPSAIDELAELDVPAPAAGEYRVVVVEDGAAGAYAIAIGARESFTFAEWLTVPILRAQIHEWEGQPGLLVLAPEIIGLLGGVVVALARRTASPVRALSVVAAGGFAGSGVSLLAQSLVAALRAPGEAIVVVPLAMGAIAIALGLAATRVGFAREAPRARTRAALAIVALLGFATWSGLLVAPALALVASAIPQVGARASRARPA